MFRFWSILFFLVPILGIAAYVMAAYGIYPLDAAWLPESYTSSGDTIDHLFNFIHLLSAAILIGTGLAIGWVVWRFSSRPGTAEIGNQKAAYIHHNTTLEIIWSIIPAGILVFLAFYQMNSWAENKMNRPTIDVNGQPEPKPPLLLVRAKQFGWEFHYAGADGKIQTRDDVYIENLMKVPSGEDVVIQLESDDVIHSFSVAELRLKQDIVPGMSQFAWFNARKNGTMEIACTELCGWGHYKMKAQLEIVSRAEFDRWLNEITQEYLPSMAEPSNENDE